MDRHEERVLLVLFIAVAMLILLLDPETGLGKVSPLEQENLITGASVGTSSNAAPFITNPIVLFLGILLLAFLAMEFLVRGKTLPSSFTAADVKRSFQEAASFSGSLPRAKKSQPHSAFQEEWDWIHQELEKIKREF